MGKSFLKKGLGQRIGGNQEESESEGNSEGKEAKRVRENQRERTGVGWREAEKPGREGGIWG